MKYSEIVDIPEPLETVKQVRDSNTVDRARADVSTFVISDRMAKQLSDVVLPQLRIDKPVNNQGLFVVGTYGTGKTHLMSVIAGIAEFSDLVDDLKNADLAEKLAPLAGKFAVIRFDIGASAMSLRDIVCTELTKGLATKGVAFSFPPLAEVTNTKDHLVEMMSTFEKVYPDLGLLFVLDEMLDFLGGRRDAELIQDLAFLREVGEVCKNTRFRFIGGLQESLFDNPRFAGAADAIRRVKDRFAQVRIAREDVAFVVRERLLPKSGAQKTRVREHLQQFTPLYEGMAERLDEFVDLYPVHPAYLSTFEQLTLVEKREVLRTIETEIRRLADQEVPADEPGVVCMDAYRQRLEDDPSARTVPEVQEVLDKSDVVRTKIRTSLPEKEYVGTALRIVDALTVHRLTTDDIRARIGLTVEELRDQLFLLPPNLPKRDAVFLRAALETIVTKTLTSVSGQFVGRNADNGQLYLDVDKDIDYDQLIAQRAESLDEEKLDAAYYTSMEEALGIRDNPYAAGHRIWAYNLPWPKKNSDRRGYLFMGAPNERSTAQPPRDFYLYFLQPFDLPKFVDEEREDEIFLRLEAPDDVFTHELRRFAGARELALESTADRRPIYEQKAREAQQAMVTWLRGNLPTAMTVTYEGKKLTLGEWLKRSDGDRSSVVNQIRSVSAHVLGEHFDARFPGYPSFRVEVTPDNVEGAVHSALKHVADAHRATGASRKILASLDLLDDGDALRADGDFASELLDRLKAANGNVVNRSDLLVERDGLRSWAPWHLEPEWLVVVAAALVNLGKAEIGFSGARVDALGLDRLTKLPLGELTGFSHLAPPASLPTERLTRAAKLLGLPPGAVPATGPTAETVTAFGTKASGLMKRVLDGERTLAEGLELWGAHLIDLVAERQGRVAAIRGVVEDLKARNSVGKLNHFAADDELLDDATAGLGELDRLELLGKAKNRVDGGASFLREAAAFYPDDALADDAQELRQQLIEALSSDTIDAARVTTLSSRIDELRRAFVAKAVASYRHGYLGPSGEQSKQVLLSSPHWATLGKLATVSLLQGGQFATLQADLADIGTLMEIDEQQLASSLAIGDRVPGSTSGPSAAARLEQVDRRASELLGSWRETLADNLKDEEIAQQISLLSEAAQKAIGDFLADCKLPDPMTDSFISAVDQAFRRFDVHRIARNDVIERLFPDDAAASPQELVERLERYITELTKGKSGEKVRIVLHDQEQSA